MEDVAALRVGIGVQDRSPGTAAGALLQVDPLLLSCRSNCAEQCVGTSMSEFEVVGFQADARNSRDRLLRGGAEMAGIAGPLTAVFCVHVDSQSARFPTVALSAIHCLPGAGLVR